MQKIEFNLQSLFATKEYAVVLLNREIQLDDAFFLTIWNNAVIRHVVDGGANHFFRYFDRQPIEVRKSMKYPEIASGDFDSITEESMARLKDPSLGSCKIIVTEDQEETDFTKALKVLHEEMKENKPKSVIAICEFTGRLDQIMANMNTLHKSAFLENPSPSTHDKTNVYLLSHETLSWLLPANHESSIIFVKEAPNFKCGVIPFQGPTRYTSTGLQWDMNTDMICQFGGLVSTSNKVVAQVVKITSHNNHSIFSLQMKGTDYLL